MSDINRQSDRKHGAERSWVPFVVTLSVIGIWGLSWALLTNLIKDPAHRGLFGDMFGAPNALFSGLALAGVVYAIFLQRQELKLQREELELTRAELRRSAEAQEKSEKALASQAEALANTARANTVTLMPTIMHSFSLELARGGKLYPVANLANIGNVPAFDVEIQLACAFVIDDDSLHKLEQQINPGHKVDFEKLRRPKEQVYWIYNQVHYPVIPPRRQRPVEVLSNNLPSLTVGIYALIQFRDLQGNNYAHIYSFEQQTLDDEHVLRLIDLNPPTPLAHSRLDVDVSDNGIELRSGDSAPDFASHFADVLKSSIPSSWLKNGQWGGVDWGDWREA